MCWKLAMQAALATDLIDISWKNFQARAKLIRLEIKTKGENLWDVGLFYSFSPSKLITE